MRKNRFWAYIFAIALLFSAIAFSACDLLPVEPNEGGGTQNEEPTKNSTHKDFLIENYNQRWNEIVAADAENEEPKLTSEHYQRFSELMAELQAIEWKEGGSKDDEETIQQQEKLDEVEITFNRFIDETSRLVRGGFYVTFDYVSYKTEDENGQLAYSSIEYWSKTPVTYQQILDISLGENSLEWQIYWDRYVTKLGEETIFADYTFTESANLVCYENEPDFYITVQETNLDGDTFTHTRDCWGEFTFWQWYKGGYSQNDERVWHEYCRDMAQRPVTCNGQLMQPDDIINSSRTFVTTEQSAIYDIDIVLEIDGESEEVGGAKMFYSHSLYEMLLYDAYSDKFGSAENKAEVLYYYLDWFELSFNGEAIENNGLREFTIDESGTLKLTGRNQYEVTFELEVHPYAGDVCYYGPYTVVVDTQGRELYREMKAEILIEEFLRKELGDEEYETVFAGLNFYLDGYNIYHIDHSCKIVAEVPVSSGGSGEEETPDEEELQQLREEERKRFEEEWAMFGETMNVEPFSGCFEKLLVRLDSDSTQEEFHEICNAVREDFEMLMEYVHLYNYLETDWETVREKYSVSETHTSRFYGLLSQASRADNFSQGEIEEIRNEYDKLRTEVINWSNTQDETTDNEQTEENDQTQTDNEIVVAPIVPEGFPNGLKISGNAVYTDLGVYVGSLYEDGSIVNVEANAIVGSYAIVLDNTGAPMSNENGTVVYSITLTMGELSYTYTV